MTASYGGVLTLKCLAAKVEDLNPHSTQLFYSRFYDKHTFMVVINHLCDMPLAYSICVRHLVDNKYNINSIIHLTYIEHQQILGVMRLGSSIL
jgi:GTP cyclohydrolase I